MPKAVPQMAKMSTASPIGPLTRLPSRGDRPDLSVSGRPLRWAKKARLRPTNA